MKLLAQSDDYGITKAVALGTIEAIRHGIIRNTGLFANMPWVEECVSWITPYLDQIAFGVDLNASTGPALLPKEKIPSLVQTDGTFFTSSMNRALDTDENNHDHVIYAEIYAEFDAQIQTFIQLVGRKPDYLHGHAYGTETTKQASLDLAKKYGIPYSTTIMEHEAMYAMDMGWYQFPPTLVHQAQSSLKQYLLEDQGHMLGHETAFLITHCGYVDVPLMNLSSFNLYRMKDLEAATDPTVLSWIKENQIELITYKDLNGWY